MAGERRVVVLGFERPALRRQIEAVAGELELTLTSRSGFMRGETPALWVSSAGTLRVSIELALDHIVPYARSGDRVLLLIDGRRLDRERAEALAALGRRPVSILIYRGERDLEAGLREHLRRLGDLELDAPDPRVGGSLGGCPIFGQPPADRGCRAHEAAVNTIVNSLPLGGDPLLVWGPLGFGVGPAVWAAAERLAERFPGGILSWRVGGDDPERVAEALGRSMWPRGSAARWLRGWLRSGERALVVLDEVAAPEDFVAEGSPLLGSSARLICIGRRPPRSGRLRGIAIGPLSGNEVDRYLRDRGLEPSQQDLAGGSVLALESLAATPPGVAPTAWLVDERSPYGRRLAGAWSALPAALQEQLALAARCPGCRMIESAWGEIIGSVGAGPLMTAPGLGAIPRGLFPEIDRDGRGFTRERGPLGEHAVPIATRRWLRHHSPTAGWVEALAGRLLELLDGPGGDGDRGLRYGLDGTEEEALSVSRLRLALVLYGDLRDPDRPGSAAQRGALACAVADYLVLFEPPDRARALLEDALEHTDGEAQIAVLERLITLELREGEVSRVQALSAGLPEGPVAELLEGWRLGELEDDEGAIAHLRAGLEALDAHPGSARWGLYFWASLKLAEYAGSADRQGGLDALAERVGGSPGDRAAALRREYERIQIAWARAWYSDGDVDLDGALDRLLERMDDLLRGGAGPEGLSWIQGGGAPIPWQLERARLIIARWLDIFEREPGAYAFLSAEDELSWPKKRAEGWGKELAAAFERLDESCTMLEGLAERGEVAECGELLFTAELLRAAVMFRLGMIEEAEGELRVLYDQIGDSPSLDVAIWGRVITERAGCLLKLMNDRVGEPGGEGRLLSGGGAPAAELTGWIAEGSQRLERAGVEAELLLRELEAIMDAPRHSGGVERGRAE